MRASKASSRRSSSRAADTAVLPPPSLPLLAASPLVPSRVRLVRGEGRGVSTLYGRGGGGLLPHLESRHPVHSAGDGGSRVENSLFVRTNKEKLLLRCRVPPNDLDDGSHFRPGRPLPPSIRARRRRRRRRAAGRHRLSAPRRRGRGWELRHHLPEPQHAGLICTLRIKAPTSARPQPSPLRLSLPSWDTRRRLATTLGVESRSSPGGGVDNFRRPLVESQLTGPGVRSRKSMRCGCSRRSGGSQRRTGSSPSRSMRVYPPPAPLPSPPRTKRTRLVLPPVLSGHVSSFPPY